MQSESFVARKHQEKCVGLGKKPKTMPVKFVTPNRAGFVIGTAAFVMIINSMFLLPSPDDSCQNYHLERILQGPVAQDDPGLLRWVRSQMVPPSRLPYNLSFFLSGLPQEFELHNSTSYSPSQEFILGQVDKIFGHKIVKGGTFLEAGAYDGEFLSNTLYLEHEFGWSGVLVEADPTFFQQLLLKRRKSWAINVCLNTKPYPSQEAFLLGSSSPVETNHMLNGNGPANPHLEKHISLGSSRLLQFRDNDTQEGRLTQVQCVPMYSVLKAMDITHVDFLSLDVERSEMGILDTIPWDKVSFTVLVVEHLTLDDLKEYLEQRGYLHVASNLADHVFVNKMVAVVKDSEGEKNKKE